jgi:hypothetical protein
VALRDLKPLRDLVLSKVLGEAEAKHFTPGKASLVR